MRSINRYAVVIRPKPAFFEWASTLNGGTIENPTSWCSVYLVDAAEGEEPDRALRREFLAIFEEQLESWHRFQDDWPAPRTYTQFENWFDAQIADMVFDLTDDDIEYDG